MQGVEHFDSIPQEQEWNTDLLQQKTERQYAKDPRGHPYHLYIGPTAIVEIGVIILSEQEETQVRVILRQFVDEVFCIDAYARFVLPDACGVD